MIRIQKMELKVKQAKQYQILAIEIIKNERLQKFKNKVILKVNNTIFIFFIYISKDK